MGGFSGRRAPFFVSDFAFDAVVVVVVVDELPFDAVDPTALLLAAAVFFVTVVVITSVVDSMVDDDRNVSICDDTGTAPANAILLNFCCSAALPPYRIVDVGIH